MRRIGILVLLASVPLCAVQEQAAKPGAAKAAAKPAAAAKSPAPPAVVDRALRARAMKFFQAHIDGKFRLAEQYVAADTKDYFYSVQKPRYLKCELVKITYSNRFRNAIVVTKCEREVMSQMGKMTFNVPAESTWKLEGGLWCWYVNQKVTPTPFGPMTRTPPTPGQQQGGLLAIKPQVASVEELWNLVSADKKVVHLPAAGGSDSVVVHNQMKGVVTLKVLMPETPGLEVVLEREKIEPADSARVTFKYQAPADAKKAPKNVQVQIHVEPSNENIPVQVIFGSEAAGK